MIFIEMPTFAADRDAHFTDASFGEFQQMLADRPDAGVLIRGGHGLRKVRWALPGRGKSGGLRVIYYWRIAESQILLVALFAKNVRTDLSPAQLGALAKTMREWLQ
jgi:hypothetical protein